MSEPKSEAAEAVAAPESFIDPNVCQAQEQTWWNQKCAGCSHNLMLHTEIPDTATISCALCEIRQALDAKIEKRDVEIDTIRVAFNGLAVPLSYPEIPLPERLEP